MNFFLLEMCTVNISPPGSNIAGQAAGFGSIVLFHLGGAK
jgi:hypothetical protein